MVGGAMDARSKVEAGAIGVRTSLQFEELVA